MAGWIRSYQRRWLGNDLIAGVAVAAPIIAMGWFQIHNFLRIRVKGPSDWDARVREAREQGHGADLQPKTHDRGGMNLL